MDSPTTLSVLPTPKFSRELGPTKQESWECSIGKRVVREPMNKAQGALLSLPQSPMVGALVKGIGQNHSMMLFPGAPKSMNMTYIGLFEALGFGPLSKYHPDRLWRFGI